MGRYVVSQLEKYNFILRLQTLKQFAFVQEYNCKVSIEHFANFYLNPGENPLKFSFRDAHQFPRKTENCAGKFPNVEM